jgi:hypothetical protein
MMMMNDDDDGCCVESANSNQYIYVVADSLHPAAAVFRFFALGIGNSTPLAGSEQ